MPKKYRQPGQASIPVENRLLIQAIRQRLDEAMDDYLNNCERLPDAEGHLSDNALEALTQQLRDCCELWGRLQLTLFAEIEDEWVDYINRQPPPPLFFPGARIADLKERYLRYFKNEEDTDA